MASNRKDPIRLDATNVKDFLASFDTLLLDCDGVLWSVDHVTRFPGVGAAISKLRAAGKRLLFVSNNPVYTVSRYLHKFPRMAGFQGREEEVVGINQAVAAYLRDVAHVDGSVYVIGTPSVAEELQAAGLRTCGVGRCPHPLVEDLSKDMVQLLTMEMEDNVKAVVVAMDTTFDYNKLYSAVNYLRDPDCVLVATNREPLMSLGVQGIKRRFPITGSLLAAVETASGREATVIGKPSENLFKYVTSLPGGMDPARTVIIGDYLDSDIAFANNCGLASVLVCTGVDDEDTYAARAASDPNTPAPTYILTSVTDLGEWIDTTPVCDT